MYKLLGVALFALLSQVCPLAMAADDLASAGTSYSLQQEALINRYLSITAGLGDTGAKGKNYATIEQTSDDSQAAINQYGRDNRATVTQSGGVHNTAMIAQTGDNNYGAATQRGNNNLALINQH